MNFDALLTEYHPDLMIDEIKRLDALDFDCLWTVEAGHNPFIPLTLAAANTTKMGLGTNISVAFARSPFSMAQTAWDLQNLSKGRFRLGLGTQVRAHVERRFSMPFDHPAARITDYVRCIRAIWDTFQNGTTPDYRGQFYQFTLINSMFTAGPIDFAMPEIHLAGVNPRMIRAAGECADGFHIHPMHSAGYINDVIKPALDEGAKMNNRSMADLVLYAPVFVVTGQNQAEMDDSLQSVRAQISFYASTPSYRALLEYHDLGAIGKALSVLMREGKVNQMPALIPDALVEEIAIIARPQELAQKLQARYKNVVHRISLYNSVPAFMSNTEAKALVAQTKS